MPPRNSTAYGLYNHVMDAIADNSTRKRDTVYVSTSASFGVAATFTQLMDPENRWVYHIAATPNMVDVNASLPNFSETVHQEAEYAAAGGIHWSQVKGWLLVPADYKPVVLFTDANVPDLSNEDFAALSDEYIKNRDYNVKWDAFTASGPQPQLAGLAESSAAKWVNDKLWSEFKGKSVQDYLREFMEANGTAIGWRDFSPLFPPTQDAEKKVEQEAMKEAKKEDQGKEVIESNQRQSPTPITKPNDSGQDPWGPNLEGTAPDPSWDGPKPNEEWDGPAPRPDLSWDA